MEHGKTRSKNETRVCLAHATAGRLLGYRAKQGAVLPEMQLSLYQRSAIKAPTSPSFRFNFPSRWYRRALRCLHALRHVSEESPQGCPRNSANIILAERRAFPTSESGTSAAYFLHSSFLQTITVLDARTLSSTRLTRPFWRVFPRSLLRRFDGGASLGVKGKTSSVSQL